MKKHNPLPTKPKNYNLMCKNNYNYHIRTSRRPIKNIWKNNRYLKSCFWGENVYFKESSSSIMITRNSNWSTEILWYGTGYTKGKVLSPLKHHTWGRLNCLFCLKLLRICFFFFLSSYDVPDSSVGEQLFMNISNFGVGKYCTAQKIWNFWLWSLWINPENLSIFLKSYFFFW